MYVERNLDNEPLFEGTQKCRTWLATTVNDPGADFKSCGATVGLYIENATDGSHGLITAVTENDITTSALTGGSLNVWTKGDTYKIYVTATKGSFISKIYIDKRFGYKVTNKKDLIGGLFLEDIDLDEDNKNVFGPGQPIGKQCI